MHTIAYVSTAKLPFSEEALIQLLEKSRDNNKRFEITGMLLYKDGNFMQVIEGPKEAVTDLYRNICADPTHYNVLTLIDQVAEYRSFPDWQMGFVNLSHSTKEISGFSDFMLHSNKLQSYEQSHGKVLLFSFRDSFR
ncbi:MAG: BLUF domain-containing protein [Rickettsiales bacterium]